MATPNTPRVTVELGGQQREILLNMHAFCAAEDITGKNYMRIDNWKELGFRDVRALLYGGLAGADFARGVEPQVKLSDIGQLVDFSNLEQIVDALASAFNAAMPAAPAEASQAKKEGDGTPDPQIRPLSA